MKKLQEKLAACERLIDSVWTLTYEVAEEGAEGAAEGIWILTFDRKNPLGYTHEAALPRCRIEEDPEGRIARKVHITRDDGSTTSYEVLNPQHIFSYEEADS